MKVICSPHMRRRAEAILKVLSCHGCASEVRIRQLLGDSPDTSKALRILLRLEEVKRTGAGGQKDPYVYVVYLYDWWLMKVETGDGSKQLGVGGLTAKERQDERVFHSAAIAKRHDSVTFVTVDGITIFVGGFINRGRTLQNGFSSEVCNLFLFGFPYDWEEYAALSFGESTNEDADFGTSDFSESVNRSADRASSSVSMSIDHLSANALRDLLLSTGPEARKLRKSIFNEIVQKYGTNPFKGGAANQKSGNPVTTENPSPNGSPSQKKKAKTSQKQEDSCIPDAKSGEEDFQEATPEDMPKKSVLGKILYKSGGSASIDGENSCLNKTIGNQVIITGASLDETPRQMKKTAVNLRKEDDNHVLQKCNDENGLSSSPRLTRGKASLYKKTKVDQKHEDKRDVHKVESGQGNFGIVDHATSSSNGPLTRSRAQKQVKRTRSRRK